MAAKKKKKYDVPRTRCNGTWTEAKFHAFVKGLLRQGHMRWLPKFKCIDDCYVGEGINPATGHKCKLHRCPGCGNNFPKGMMKADHIFPVIPVTGFTTWDDCVQGMFKEQNGYQALCADCHHIKSSYERNQRKESRN